MSALQATGTRIDAKTLLDWMGYRRQGPCKRALERQGVKVFDGKNGIWTTVELVNAAGLNKNLGEPAKEQGNRDWL